MKVQTAYSTLGWWAGGIQTCHHFRQRLAVKPQRHYLEASDEELIRWTVDGDRLAFEQIVRRHGLTILRVARRLVPEISTTDDLVQETFMRAWRNAAQFNSSRGTLIAWLYRIVTNLCIDARRRHKPHISPLDIVLVDPSPLADELIERADNVAGLSKALAMMPPHYAVIFTLIYDEGLSYVEAASILGLSVKAVERRLSRMRGQLRLCLMSGRGT